MTSSNTELIKIQIRPGINKNTTEYAAEGTYVSCDKIRFEQGLPEKLGGWQKEVTDRQFDGVSRDIITWADLESEEYIGVGTHKKLELYNGGVIYDVTPIEASATATDAITTSAGSTQFMVSVVNNRNPGDFVVFTCATASVGGINIDPTSSYPIASATTTYFIVSTETTATSSESAVGGPLIVDFPLFTGLADNGAAFGWGAGTWGTPGVSVCAGWGEPRGGGVATDLRQWSFDNWGEDWVANVRGGNIYYWEASAGTSVRAQVISSAAPSIVNFTLVAQPSRFVVAFGTHDVSGTFDPLLVRWSDSENFDEWVASAGNQAGDFRIESGSFIIGAVKTRREIILFTDAAVHSMRFIGGGFVFAFDNMGTAPGPASQHAAVDVNGVVYWMSPQGFYVYNGVVKSLESSLDEFLFENDSPGNINFGQKEKVYSALNSQFNEIWWFYPSRDSTENDRYVIHNYREDTWYHGTIDRTVWNDIDIFDKPYAIDPDGNLFIHEQGTNDDTGNLKAFLTTAMYDIGDGDQLMYIDRVIPDATINRTLNYSLESKKYPNSGADQTTSKGPFAVTSVTNKFHPRLRGRQVALTYSCSVTNSDFRLGTTRVAIKPDGGR
jgi:hypothetical protein